MNILDENILESQRQLLRSWRIPCRQVGVDVGRNGMADEDILPLLLTKTRPTFFTRDLGFADGRFCHPRYCLVIVAAGQYEAAHYVRRFLQHPSFDSAAKRLGAVVKLMPTGSTVWRSRTKAPQVISWSA